VNPIPYQTPAGRAAQPQVIKRRSGEAAAVWRVIATNGRWRMPSLSERAALIEAYGEPGPLCAALPSTQ
jgi:hypothetical protein